MLISESTTPYRPSVTRHAVLAGQLEGLAVGGAREFSDRHVGDCQQPF